MYNDYVFNAEKCLSFSVCFKKKSEVKTSKRRGKSLKEKGKKGTKKERKERRKREKKEY